MKRFFLLVFVVGFCLFNGSGAFADDLFSSPAAARNFSQYGDISTAGNPSLLISFVEQNNATEIAYRSQGCSTGCSNGCSSGCSNGCTVGCSVGCSVGCKY